MNEIFVTIAKFQYSTEAQIVKGKLESEGIKVFMADQVLIDTDPLVSQAIGGVKLKVWKEDKSKALKILEEINDYSLDDAGNQLECPICGSHKITMHTSIKDFKSFFSFLISFLTFALPIHTKYDYYCENCKNKFNQE